MNYFTLALRNIKHRKLRASLTTIGIIIGIAAIISLISISQGFQNAITAEFEEMGSRRIYLMGEGGMQAVFSAALTEDDVDVLESISEFEWVNPYTYTAGSAEFSDEEKTVPQIVAFGAEDLERTLEDSAFKIVEGRYIKDGEKGSVFIGDKFAKTLFEKEVRIGNNILLKGEKFKVVGILENMGSSQDDNGIYMGIDDFRSIFNLEGYNMIEAKVKEGFDINEVAEKVQNKLEKKRDNDNFEVYTPEQLMSQVKVILDIIELVLVAIAAISLVVGGVGIMNSMYTSVLERTREIGIMKSIGAKRGTILTIFLVEAGSLGLVGGIIGCLFGAIISYGIQFITKTAGFKYMNIEFNIWLYLSAFLFAFLIGMISGVLPAKEATDLKPVEALRYGT